MYWQSCVTSQSTVDKGKQKPEIRMPVLVVGQFFNKVVVDIVGLVKPVLKVRNLYVLVMVDFLTCYTEAVPLRNIEAATVTEALITMSSRVGFLKEVLMDRGAQFMSQIMRTF